jgi:hypothetical protein
LSRMNRPNFSINAESMWIASNASTPSNALLDYASMLAGLGGCNLDRRSDTRL